ncbi:MAG TPA: polyprenol monophosphomannose synthase [Actinomycetota bacterium]|nr:polyprenol monophosphomannose synthase [Actinomycetota bacterium]
MDSVEPGLVAALVVVPTYNERDTISEVVARLFRGATHEVELLVVDDASPDGTAQTVRALAERYPIHLLERPRKLGLGTAYVAAFRWALERGYPAIVEMDGDLSHDPADVGRLLDALEEADLAIGSRYVEEGRIPRWGLLRRALSRGGNAYARRMLATGVRDSTSGLRAYRAGILGAVDLPTVRSEGYAFQIEMTRRVRMAGGAIVEVPITFDERAGDRSKMSRAIVLEALARVTLWGVRDRIGGLVRRGHLSRSDGDAAPQQAEGSPGTPSSDRP